MKNFKEFINEEIATAGLSSTNVPHDINDADVKSRINAILGHCAVSEFMTPSAALNQIEAKLNQLGIAKDGQQDIDMTESGTYSVSFKRYGDIFGKKVDTPHGEFDEETRPVLLNLRVEKLESGSFKVYGSLV